MGNASPIVAYPPIEKHGLIGDRRTAALVAADGTLDWLCLPNYDDAPVFGSLLDVEQGGFWRFGPSIPALGEQRYFRNSAILSTLWSGPGWQLELTDFMPQPRSDRPSDQQGRRVVIRQLLCRRGQVDCSMRLAPRDDFGHPARVETGSDGLQMAVGPHRLGLWTSFPVQATGDTVGADLALRVGEPAWMVLDLDASSARWSAKAAQDALDATREYWQNWLG